MAQHVKSRSINVSTKEVEVEYYTDEEWAARVSEKEVTDAVEAARDLVMEEIEQMGRIFIAYLKVQAKREGVTLAQIKQAIKDEL